MDHNDPPEVMMLAIEQVQLFFLAHPECGHRMTDVHLIYQGVKKLQACSPHYGKALSIWNAKDTTFCMIWINSRTMADEEYVEVLAHNGRRMLTKDGYASYHTIAKEDTMALTESLV